MSWKKIEIYGSSANGHQHFDKELLEKWLEGKGIVTWMGGKTDYNVPQTLKTGRNTIGDPNHVKNLPPYNDHIAFFKATNPLKLWYVYHPYHEISDVKPEVEEWALVNNLEVKFFDKNECWFWKGNAITIVLTTK